MNNIVKSVVFAAVVLFAGIAAMQVIYKNQDATGDITSVEPAAGEAATITEGQPADAQQAQPVSDTAAAVEEVKEDAAAATEEVKEEVAPAVDAAKEGAADAVDATKDAAADAVDATKDAAEDAVDATKDAVKDAADAAEKAAE